MLRAMYCILVYAQYKDLEKKSIDLVFCWIKSVVLVENDIVQALSLMLCMHGCNALAVSTLYVVVV